MSSYIALSNWIWKIYHIDIILRPKLCQFVQFEISPSMSHTVFIFLKITQLWNPALNTSTWTVIIIRCRMSARPYHPRFFKSVRSSTTWKTPEEAWSLRYPRFHTRMDQGISEQPNTTGNSGSINIWYSTSR